MSITLKKIRCAKCGEYHDVIKRLDRYEAPFMCRHCGVSLVQITVFTDRKSLIGG